MGKRGRVRLFFLLLAAVAAGWLVREAQLLREPAALTVPACDIAVDCRRVLLATSERLQSIVDRPDLAAWYGPYILDHAGQGFRGLWNIAPGDTVTVAARPYRCRFVTTGWSDCGIRPKSGPLPAAALYLCTCVPAFPAGGSMRSILWAWSRCDRRQAKRLRFAARIIFTPGLFGYSASCHCQARML